MAQSLWQVYILLKRGKVKATLIIKEENKRLDRKREALEDYKQPLLSRIFLMTIVCIEGGGRGEWPACAGYRSRVSEDPKEIPDRSEFPGHSTHPLEKKKGEIKTREQGHPEGQSKESFRRETRKEPRLLPASSPSRRGRNAG